jgi:hypothetical protein
VLTDVRVREFSVRAGEFVARFVLTLVKGLKW